MKPYKVNNTYNDFKSSQRTKPEEIKEETVASTSFNTRIQTVETIAKLGKENI